jgi:hypothetical protein
LEKEKFLKIFKKIALFRLMKKGRKGCLDLEKEFLETLIKTEESCENFLSKKKSFEETRILLFLDFLGLSTGV